MKMIRSWAAILALGLATTLASAQNVTVNPGAGNYADLKTAFDRINDGTHTGAVVISITGDTTETAPAVLNASGSGAASYTSINITPSGARTVAGAIVAGSPLIDLNGADNVTIDGLATAGNSLTIANTTVSATSGTATIRFIGGATSNVITNSNIQGSGTMSVATNGATIFFSTDAVTANGNDNNTISNNNIGPAGANLPSKGILCNGSTTTTALGNSGNSVTNNNFVDIFAVAVTSSAMAANNGCNTWSITNNRFYQTGTRTWTTGATHRAIDINSSAATSGAQGFTITGNIIGYAAPNQTGTYSLTGSTGKFQAIQFNGITGGAVSTIANNTIANVSLSGVTSSGTSTSAIFIGVLASNGVINVTSNTIGSQTATGSILISTTTTTATDVIGIYNFTVDAATYNDNQIGGITANNAGATGAFIVYGIRNNTGNTLTLNASGNLIGGTVANSIQNNSTSTTAQTLGLVLNLGILNVRNNVFRNLTGAGGTGTGNGASVIGISATTATPNHTLEANTISALSNTNAAAATVVSGINYTGGTGANLVHRNLIHSLSAASATAIIHGIDIRGGTTVYRNNMIRLGTDAAGADITAGVSINGINEFLGTNTIFNNSVLIRGTGVLGTANTFAFNGQQTVNTRSFQNNNFYNARSNGAGTGKHYGIRVGGSAPNPAGLTSNYNNVFVDGTGGVFGFFNALDVADLAAWQAATGQDANSLSANPAYVSFSDLHLTNASPSRNVGLVIASVTNDFDNKSRPGANALYDIGADEFDGIAPLLNDIAATAFIDPTSPGTKLAGTPFSPQASFNNAGTNAQVGVPVRYRIVDAGSVEVYNQTTTIASLASGASATVTFPAATLAAGTYTLFARAELPGDGGPANDQISGTLNVLAPLAGTYTIGTGGNFPSLTANGGVFQALNVAGASGNIVLNIVSDLTAETGANALNELATGITVRIQPTGAPRTVSGIGAPVLVGINGADNLTIDGSLTGGTAAAVIGGDPSLRNLTFINTNPATLTGVLQIASGATGAQNVTIRNVNVIGADPTTTLIGIAAGGAALGSAGTDNDNVRIENNSVQKTILGIYSTGASAANPNTGNLITRNDMTGTGANRVRRGGILSFNQDGIDVSMNAIGGIDSNESADSYGIGLGVQDANATQVTNGGVTNAVVSRNRINGVVSASATGFSAFGIGVAGGTTGPNTIVNNAISGVTAPSTAPDLVAGIFVAGVPSSSTRVQFNSISLSGDRGAVATQSPGFGIAITGVDPTVELKNNIFATTQIASGGGANAKAYAIGTASTTFANLDANFNLYFSAGAQAGFFRSGSVAVSAGTDYATLALWQAAIADDASSLFGDPLFVSTSDLHLGASSPALNVGTPIIGVTLDIDGQTRESPPEIGADEVLAATLTITPNSVDFGNQAVGSTSSEQTVTLANTGSSPLDVTALTAPTTPFARTGTGSCAATLPITIAGGASCTLTYTFAPTAAGPASQPLTVTANAPGSGTITLSGTGTQGNLTITPGTVNFGNQGVGSTSSEQTVTLANTGNLSLNVTALTAAAAPFARTGTGTCAATLPITIAAGANCTLTYTFAPTATGPASQPLTVTANAPGSGTLTLSGTGVQGNLTITPGTVNFGNQTVGSTSGAQTVTLANTGTASLDVTALTAAATPFARTGAGTCAATLPITIAAGSNCTLTYTFSPTATGAANQTLTVTANAPGSGSIALSGTGIPAGIGNLTIAPTTVNFGNQNTGTTSAAQTVTLGNNGTLTLTVNSLTTANAPFTRVGTGTCSGALPFTIAVGASCTLQYTFSPTVGGAATQNITVGVDGTGGGPFTLNGTGVVVDNVFRNGFEDP